MEKRTNAKEMTLATTLFIIIGSLIGALIIRGTMYDIFKIQLPKWREERLSVQASLPRQAKDSRHGYQSIAEKSLLDSLGGDERTRLLSSRSKSKKYDTSLTARLLLPFSIYTS